MADTARRKYVCIMCPLGCTVEVESRGGEILRIEGCECKRGEEYIRKEHFAPERVLTSSVRVIGGELPLVSVRTAQPIPKSAIRACMKQIHSLKVNAPVRRGDVIVGDLAGTGVALIATRSNRAAEGRNPKNE